MSAAGTRSKELSRSTQFSAPTANPPPLASQVWPDKPVPPSDPPGDPMPRVQETDVRDDRAMQQVLQSIRQVAERRQEVMMVLSQLQFREYLDNQVDPITAAASRLLPRPATLGIRDGDLDILLVSRQYGLVVGEVKSVGHKPKYTTDQAIVKTVQKAVKQLKKADVTLRQLVSDLAPVNVTRILMLPNITSQRLMTALSTDPQTEQDLCQCVGATDTAAAVARCLCSDSCDQWWERSVTDHGQDTNMTNDIYERLVARNLGVIFDNTLSMREQVNKVCQCAYFELRRISSIRQETGQ
nr:hypothetical protein BaRGS_017466 [Batillaria attramentaria]